MMAQLYGLDRFRLTLAGLLRLGRTPVRVHVTLRSFDVSPKVARLEPAERHPYLRSLAQTWVATLTKRFAGAAWRVESARRVPAWLEGSLPASDVRALLAARGVLSVALVRVAGRRPRAMRDPLSWFCVRARVVIQLEGATRGLQTVEDRFILVRAATERDACQSLKPTWRSYAKPYLNSTGHLVRWQLEEVTDVYEVVAEHVNDLHLAEVYSKLGKRRMRPEFQWPRSRSGRPTTR